MEETQETWVPSLGWEDPLEKEMVTPSCLENPTDRGAWRAMVQGVTKSWMQPSDWRTTGDTEDLSPSLSVCRGKAHGVHGEEVAIYKPGWEVPVECNPDGTSILDSQKGKETNVCCWSDSVCAISQGGQKNASSAGLRDSCEDAPAGSALAAGKMKPRAGDLDKVSTSPLMPRVDFSEEGRPAQGV